VQLLLEGGSVQLLLECKLLQRAVPASPLAGAHEAVHTAPTDASPYVPLLSPVRWEWRTVKFQRVSSPGHHVSHFNKPGPAIQRLCLRSPRSSFSVPDGVQHAFHDNSIGWSPPQHEFRVPHEFKDDDGTAPNGSPEHGN
jgi:hypothetical protein